MDDKIKTCQVCGEKNEPEYAFCKNCGNQLETENSFEKEQPQPQAPNFDNRNAGTDQSRINMNQVMFVEDFDGIPMEDMITFVGRKAPQIIPKFTKMKITNTKTSWCWPVAVLSFLFGPLGAAIWFFYRKMYKVAFYFMAIGTILEIFTDILAKTGIPVLNELKMVDSNLLLHEALEDFNIGVQISNAINVVTAVISALFSMKWYKDFAVRRINDYRLNNADPRYYKMGLSMVGGTSDGMAVLGVAVFLVATSLSLFLANSIF